MTKKIKNQPLYLEIKEKLKYKILTWNYVKGYEFPSERDIAKEYHVSRMTAKKALNLLENEGYIYRIQGKGSFLHHSNLSNKIDIGDKSALGLHETVELIGKKGTSKVLSFNKTQGPQEVIEYFDNTTNDFYELKRLRLVDNNPFCFQITYLSYLDFIDAERYDFSIFSIYDFLDIHNSIPQKFRKELTTIYPNQEILNLLNIEKNSCIFLLIYIGLDSNDKTIEVTYSYFNPNLVRFTYSTTLK